METLANLESFVRSAQAGSFSAAARRLALSPAAVSRNVAHLERNLGVRLFYRSTRGLTLSEAGERFLESVQGGLDVIQGAICEITANAGEPAGVLKLNAAPGLGMEYLLPLMPTFIERYPAVIPDWTFDNRPLDLIAGGFDVAIGGGFDLPLGMVARELGRIKIIAVAAPSYMRGRNRPKDPSQLIELDGLVMRSSSSNRLRTLTMQNIRGLEMAASQTPIMIVNGPDALCRATVLGLGISLIAQSYALPYLAKGELEWLLPDWYCDFGPISLYYASRKLLPAKTRAFVDFITEAFNTDKVSKAFATRSTDEPPPISFFHQPQASLETDFTE